MEKRSDLQWNRLMHDFEEYLKFTSDEKSASNKHYKENSRGSYISYLNSLDKANGGQTVLWLNEALKEDDPHKVLSDKLKNLKCDKSSKTISNWKSALIMLGDFMFGFTRADSNLKSISKFDETACKLVAQSAIFCPVYIYELVKKGECGSRNNARNDYGSWYNCKYKRAGTGEKKGQVKDNGVKIDDNTYANRAIKLAVLEGLKHYGLDTSDLKFDRYEACHIWPGSCQNEKYHTSVANLVLLPREIAGLTDHCKAVEDLLKYEAFRRFGFKPDPEDINPGEYAAESEPLYYDKVVWRPESKTPQSSEK